MCLVLHVLNRLWTRLDSEPIFVSLGSSLRQFETVSCTLDYFITLPPPVEQIKTYQLGWSLEICSKWTFNCKYEILYQQYIVENLTISVLYRSTYIVIHKLFTTSILVWPQDLFRMTHNMSFYCSKLSQPAAEQVISIIYYTCKRHTCIKVEDNTQHKLL